MIYTKVCQFIEEHRMLKEGDLVLAGVSGGADSIAMLDMLSRYREKTSFQLQVVHVNHGIRGAEALRDQQFVERLCTDSGIPCRVCMVDAVTYAKEQGIGLEEAGRALRKEVFHTVAGELYGEKAAPEEAFPNLRIALAHNQNDLAETVLHHLARGSGLRGLSGIRPVKGNRIRPLLGLQRAEIEAYLKERGLSFVSDSTNFETDYTRNRIRLHVLPVLEQEVNKETVAHLSNTAMLAASVEDYLSRQGRTIVSGYRCPDGQVEFTSSFFQEDPLLRQYAVREALFVLAGARKDLTLGHIRSVLELEKKEVRRQVDLPYDLRAVRTYQGIRIERKGEEKEASVREKEWLLPVPGELSCGSGHFFCRVFSFQKEKIPEKPYTKWLDYDKIETILTVRTRKAGDYLVISREGSRKKLNRCMIDDKIPFQKRDGMLLVASGSEILWIVGGRFSEKYKITADTVRVLEIVYRDETLQKL